MSSGIASARNSLSTCTELPARTPVLPVGTHFWTYWRTRCETSSMGKGDSRHARVRPDWTQMREAPVSIYKQDINPSMLLSAPLIHPESRQYDQKTISKLWLPVENRFLSLNDMVNTFVHGFQIAVGNYHLEKFRRSILGHIGGIEETYRNLQKFIFAEIKASHLTVYPYERSVIKTHSSSWTWQDTIGGECQCRSAVFLKDRNASGLYGLLALEETPQKRDCAHGLDSWAWRWRKQISNGPVFEVTSTGFLFRSWAIVQ